MPKSSTHTFFFVFDGSDARALSVFFYILPLPVPNPAPFSAPFSSGTCAWNTVLVGRKKWGFFPPGTGGTHMENIHSQTCQSGTAPGGPCMSWWMDDAPVIPVAAGMIECIQEPGMYAFGD